MSNRGLKTLEEIFHSYDDALSYLTASHYNGHMALRGKFRTFMLKIMGSFDVDGSKYTILKDMICIEFKDKTENNQHLKIKILVNDVNVCYRTYSDGDEIETSFFNHKIPFYVFSFINNLGYKSINGYVYKSKCDRTPTDRENYVTVKPNIETKFLVDLNLISNAKNRIIGELETIFKKKISNTYIKNVGKDGMLYVRFDGLYDKDGYPSDLERSNVDKELAKYNKKMKCKFFSKIEIMKVDESSALYF